MNVNDEDDANAEALHLAAQAPVLRRDAAIERLRDELRQSRNYWSDQFSRERAKAREADASIARLSAELEAAREGLERLASLVPFPARDELGVIHPQIRARAAFARAVLAKLSEGV